MPINLMDLYQDESADKDSSQSTQDPSEQNLEPEVNTPQAESAVLESSDNPQDSVIQDVSSTILDSVVESQDVDSQHSESSVEMTDEEKKEYGMTSIPKKIEIEDLEQQTSDFLKDPSLDNQVPEDLEYSSVFKSKTIVNYTLAISGFALLVVGVFSFLNSQSVDIQSSLDVISETGKGSLADAGPPGMDFGAVIGALGGSSEGQTSSGDSGDANVTGESSGAGEQGSEDTLLDADDVLADDSVDNDSEQQDVELNSDTSTADSAVADDQDSQNDPFSNINDDDFADLFGPLPGSESGFFGSENTAGTSGASNPNDSDLNQLITDNDIQLDLLDDDSNVNNNGFLSNTNNTIITSGNIAGDSGPEIYLVLFMSLIFAGYLTTRTS
jgi:hypothetical protein